MVDLVTVVGSAFTGNSMSLTSEQPSQLGDGGLCDFGRLPQLKPRDLPHSLARVVELDLQHEVAELQRRQLVHVRQHVLWYWNK